MRISALDALFPRSEQDSLTRFTACILVKKLSDRSTKVRNAAAQCLEGWGFGRIHDALGDVQELLDMFQIAFAKKQSAQVVQSMSSFLLKMLTSRSDTIFWVRRLGLLSDPKFRPFMEHHAQEVLPRLMLRQRDVVESYDEDFDVQFSDSN